MRFSSIVVPGPRRNRLGKQSSGLASQREIEKFYGRYKTFVLAKRDFRKCTSDKCSNRRIPKWSCGAPNSDSKPVALSFAINKKILPSYSNSKLRSEQF